jgi:hypothetical protein
MYYFGGKYVRNRSLRRFVSKWEENIIRNLREIGWEIV